MTNTSPLAWMGTLILPLSKPAPSAFGLGNTQLCPLVLQCLSHDTQHPLTQQMVLYVPRGYPGVCFRVRSLVPRYRRMERKTCSLSDLLSDLTGVYFSLFMVIQHQRRAAALTSTASMGTKDERAKAQQLSMALQACPVQMGG